MSDLNAVRRKCKILKCYTTYQEKIEVMIDNLQEGIKAIDWTEETILSRIRIYKELGEIIEVFRDNRIKIKWYKKQLLEKANLTG